MEKQLIMFQNITVAVRAKNVLERAGIHGYVQKTPVFNNRPSCGYSLLVRDNPDKAIQILKEKGFVILGITSVKGQ